jgi:hypothetical protein
MRHSWDYRLVQEPNSFFDLGNHTNNIIHFGNFDDVQTVEEAGLSTANGHFSFVKRTNLVVVRLNKSVVEVGASILSFV